MTEQHRRLRSTTEQLAYLRDDFSDQIPLEMVLSNSPDNKFKVRRGWFAGVMIALDKALNEGLITDQETIKEAEEFVSWVCEGDFGTRDPRSPTLVEEVQKANNILDKVLGRNKNI